MRIRHLRWPSPALVVSMVALVVALGGTSYAAFKLPKRVVFVESLPRNTAGKLLKRELRRSSG